MALGGCICIINSQNTFTVQQQRGRGRQEIKIKIFIKGIGQPLWREYVSSVLTYFLEVKANFPKTTSF